jgi:phosphatidylglycerophosphatase A
MGRGQSRAGEVPRLIATFFGVGYMPKGGGTLAAALSCVIWYLAWGGGRASGWLEAIVMAVIFLAGVWSAGRMEAVWGKDSYRIVVDEVAGMCLTLCWMPVRWPYILAGLVLFRFFDIAKPLYIRKMEQLEGGWGVMMDDVLAGVYANLLLQLARVFSGAS